MTAREVSSERVSELEAQAYDCTRWDDRLNEIVEKAVEASDRLDMSSEQMAAYAALLALRSSVKTVGVKKLEWRVLTEGFSLQRAETTLGDYRIWREVSGAWFWSLYDGEYSGGSEDKEDQAKAAAQADYERRIMSALEAGHE